MMNKKTTSSSSSTSTNGTKNSSSSTSSSNSSSCVTTSVLSHLAVAIISFQLGSVSNFTHYSTISRPDYISNNMKDNFFQSNDCKCSTSRTTITTDISEEQQRLRLLQDPDTTINIKNKNDPNLDGNSNPNDDAADGEFDSTTDNDFFKNATVDTTIATRLNKLFVGSTLVSRESFITHFDIGVPWDMHHYSDSDVLLLYSDTGSFPTKTTTRKDIIDDTTTQSSSSSSLLFPNVQYSSATDATENCDNLKVLLFNKDIGQCIAIVPQWESYIVHKFLRFKDERLRYNRKLPLISKNYPLRYVSRYHSEKKGGAERDARIPTMSQLQRYLPLLSAYITNLDTVLDTLRPILDEMMERYRKLNGLDEIGLQAQQNQQQKRGRRKKQKVRDKYAVVVMVCNYGQAELFLNFICTAKSRGLDISRVLLFATDTDIYNLAKTISDISVFYVGDAFGGEDVIPKTAAKVYGDKVFTGMMFSKVYCVHLINYLGYDVLFQDVDIVWYKNPIEFFENSVRSGNYDFYFQDDGARSNRYAPYSPNSGFYYVRYNQRTSYFFSVFMRMGDSVIVMASHQAVLNALLVEQSSSKGLRVKTFERDSKLGLEYPGGFQYHYRKHWMKSFAKGQHDSTLFHMSWTKNKDNKIKFFQQMGDWFLQDTCTDKLADDIDGITDNFYDTCCSTEMLFQCHYSDKPSKKSCRGTATIDRTGRSFW